MGRIVVQNLLERGDTVTVFSQGNSKPEWWSRVDHILGDRTQREDFKEKLKGKQYDAVIDMRAFRKEDVESAIETFQGNVGRYVMISSGSVYADGKLDFAAHCPFRESDVDWASLDYTYPKGEDEYGVGKRHCEKWLQENSDVPYTIIRPPFVMGWDDPTGRTWWWMQRALDGHGVIIPMEDRAPFRGLYVADAAENFLRALDSPHAVNQTYHIAMQEIITIERWAQMVWRAAGHECEITYVPREVIRKHELLRNYEPAFSRIQVHDLPFVPELWKSERDFGLKTTPVEQWIQTTVEWYRTHYNGKNSEGYEHREAELQLATKWRAAIGKLTGEFAGVHGPSAHN